MRNSNNLTQTQLADALGLAFSTISMYERGEREPDFETLETIADYFNVTMDFLHGKSIDNKKISSADVDKGENRNTIKIAGRDGSFVERNLTDEQLDLFKKMIDQLPDADDL